MNRPSLILSLALLSFGCAMPAAIAQNARPDFVPLLDSAHLGGWTWGNEMVMKDGAWQTFGNGRRGINYYTGQTFSDFIVRLEFKADEGTSNSGVFLRTSPTDLKKGYEVQIYGLNGPDEPTGSFYKVRKPTIKAQKPPGQWNEMEITAIGQKYTVRLNGQVINELTGDRELTGNFGLQSHNKGPVQIRNVMIKDLSQTAPVAPATPSAPGLAAKPDDTTVDILSQQAPNAIEWALAPLDQGVPGDIRQNLTFLREDLLDESTKPKANPEAYKLGAQLCNTLLSVLQERSQTAGRAGFRAVEANARTGVNSQALDARRNYKMSWPQFAREESQRAELKSQAQNNAEVMKERPKLEWLQRTQQLRPGLDTAYAQFRAALRQPAPAKP